MPQKKKSGYYYFMLDFKKRQENSGRKIHSLQQIQQDERCGEEWRALSDAERKRYNDKAKERRANGEEKLTGLGESLKVVEKQQNDQLRYEMTMKQYINDLVEQAIHFDDLDKISFYFIHVNWYYTKTDKDTNVVDYHPAEFAVVEFTLNDGAKRTYHEIIKVVIETGYTREAMEHSDATHKIDIDHKGNPTDYKELYYKLFSFLSSQSGPKEKLPVLYTSRKMKNVVPCLLKRMADAAGVPHDTFNLYSLEYLFGTLMMRLNENFPEESNRASLAEAELEKDAFIYTPNIECSYHRGIEGTGEYCSHSIVTQWGYTLCDYCCQLLNIAMRSGIHRPCSVDELASSIEQLSIKKVKKVSQLKSETGVSEAYRMKVGERSRRDDEQRKKEGKDITIIDYSVIQEEKSSITIPSAAASTSTSPPTKLSQSIRCPQTLSQVLKGNTDSAPALDENEFPAIGFSKPKHRSFKKK
ncbi:protein maelstrom homolog [Microplitis mediator]|uniref:protein maelstrom homolog n=1 Tax=Microplitis mediator TaxID=375433 RepID=UPI002554F006|nr:protein maelstrom homolog [Microplitis mediator]